MVGDINISDLRVSYWTIDTARLLSISKVALNFNQQCEYQTSQAAGEREFQTAWFVVSLLTEIAVVFSLRTRLLAIRSVPGKMLIAVSLIVSVVALAIPYMRPLTQRFGFVPLPLPVTAALLAIVLVYVAATELTKHWFYKFK